LGGCGASKINRQLAAEGAAPLVWAPVVASVGEIGGRYCENCHVGQIVPGDATIPAVNEGVRGHALDPDTAEALWETRTISPCRLTLDRGKL
jgi:hypothetical protein